MTLRIKEKVFPGVDQPHTKFCLLTLSGTEQPIERPEFAFFLAPNRATPRPGAKVFSFCCRFRSYSSPTLGPARSSLPEQDMEIARKMYNRAGVLWKEARGSDPEENPWGVKLSTMFQHDQATPATSKPARNWRKKAGNFTATCSHGADSVTCHCTKPSFSTSMTTASPHLKGFQVMIVARATQDL